MKKAPMIFICLALVLSVLAAATGCGGQKKQTIGILQYMPHPSLDKAMDGFIDALAEAGYEDGKNITLDIQNAQGEAQTNNMIAGNFVSKKYDMIYAIATPSAVAAQTSAAEEGIPVVFAAVTDAVEAKLVDSNEAPGKGVTGASDAIPLDGQIEMIREFMPDSKKMGIIYTTDEINSQVMLRNIEAFAPQFGFELEVFGITDASEIPLAMDALIGRQIDMVNLFTDNTIVNNIEVILDKANEAGLPVFGSETDDVSKGCVASISMDYYANGIQAGKMAAQILEGVDPGTIPVAFPENLSVVGNRAALSAMGLTVPDSYASDITYVDGE